MFRNILISHGISPWMRGAFQDRGIDLEWSDVPEGTGRMVELLNTKQADLAVILTEGLIRAISSGLPALIAQKYINSPLLWGIHVDYNSGYNSITELPFTRAAISRFGSGSHLMAFVNAKNLNWPEKALDFEMVNTLEGAIDALGKGQADYFMWEKFTTQPLVDQKVFRRLGVCPTPWPCFVIAARTDFALKNPGLLSDLLETINAYTSEFKQIPSIDRTLANTYGQELSDIREWLSLTQWSQEQISIEDLDNVIITLSDLNLLTKSISIDSILLKHE